MTILLQIILLLGAALRFYNNTAVALWHDEAFSALYLRYPWGEMFERIIADVHPPLYYIVLRVWSMFAGDSLLSLRLLSIIFGVLTIWAGYLFVKAAFGSRKLALLSALLLAINPFQIQYALEARMYTLGTFLVLLSSYFLVRALDGDRVRHWVVYAVLVAAGLYTHYFILFSILAQAIFILIHLLRKRQVKTLANALIAYSLSTALYLPWLPSFLVQIKRVQGSYWIPELDRWSVPGTIWKMAFGGTGARHLALVITTIIAGLILVYFIRKVSSFYKWLVALGVLVPFLAAVGLSIRTNLYLDRYFVFASLYFTILLTLALSRLPNRFLRSGAILVFVAMSVFAFFKNWADLGIETKPGMAAASRVINQNAKPEDKIYVGSSFIFFTFQYYNGTPVRPLLISSAPLSGIPHFSGTAILEQEDLIMDLSREKKGQTIWLLWTTGFGGSKPGIPKNWQMLSEDRFADAPGFKGDIYVSRYRTN